MPSKPKRPCRYPGCPNLSDSSYCEEHRKLNNKVYNKYQRNSESNKRYGSTWREIRRRYVETQPLCEECKKAGRIVPVQEVHHIQPLDEGGTNEFRNLKSLCHACHMKIHGKLKTETAVEG